MTTSVIFTDLRINMAEQFVESVSEPTPNTKIYLSFGKCDAWANDSAPPSANCSVATVYDIWSNMIGGKKIYGGDLKHVTKRHNWGTGNTYIAYDHMNGDLCVNDNLAFYVVNSEYNVYKCLSNNKSSPSTIEPTSTVPNITHQTGDGYIWKYMYTISDAEKLRFTTDTYIPVKTLSEDDGSLQWQVQENAIDGAIHYIEVANTGLGYSNANSINVVVKGDGTDFSGYVVLSGNTVDKIVITNVGDGYTFANVTLTGGETTPVYPAVLKPIISPPGGHGSNALYELGGKNVLVDARLRYSEEGILPTVNDYRQIALIKDPYLRGTSEVAYIPAYLQASSTTCEGFGNFTQDEIVYQGTSLEEATFTGRVLSWSTTSNELLLINTVGSIVPLRALTGVTSQTVRVVSTSEVKGTLEPYSGKIMYVDNLKPIIRSSDQIEDFKIIVKF